MTRDAKRSVRENFDRWQSGALRRAGNVVFGSRTVKRGGDWVWKDTGKPVFGERGEIINAPPCPKCGMHLPANGHDPCIANLPGVDFACCGHGNHAGYIVFTKGPVIDGLFRDESRRRR